MSFGLPRLLLVQLLLFAVALPLEVFLVVRFRLAVSGDGCFSHLVQHIAADDDEPGGEQHIGDCPRARGATVIS